MPDSSFFAEMALELHAEATMADTLARIVEFAQQALACDQAGILLVHSRSRLETMLATNDAVERSHDLQRKLDEGPCLDAIEGDPVYVSGDVEADGRWPRWGAEVAPLGLRSVISVRLASQNRRYGSLNLYSHRTHAWEDGDVDVARVFARHASVAVATSHQEDGLKVAADTRNLIGQAQGILMERFDIDADRAFAVLSRVSQQRNIKLRSLAEDLVANRADAELFKLPG
ncbi:GAF and ANTAR domain-containing protein [Aeromicrobium alkaliterrae]|uniref:GAF and ANTAR domain-containing protein n=1 Tax=Aeromicrobium alkaliterrae TaxID=302168 RepID=A0ABN2JE96_9ACTN